MKILVLAAHHVRELLPYRECADVMREALAQLARGEIQQPLRTVVRPRDAAGFMGLMPAASRGRTTVRSGCWIWPRARSARA